jgi:hypothetical protein
MVLEQDGNRCWRLSGGGHLVLFPDSRTFGMTLGRRRGGIPTPLPWNPASRPAACRARLKLWRKFVAADMAALLLLLMASLPMFRAAAVALALALLGGANTALLCQAWCEPVAAAAAGCHENHQGSSARLTGENCEDLAAATAVLARGSDVRSMSGAAPVAHTAAAAILLVCSTSRASSGYEPHARPALQGCPLETTLRI